MEEVNTPFLLGMNHSETRIYSSHKLCQSCERIFLDADLDDPKKESSGKHHPTLQALQESASRGCRLCETIRGARAVRDCSPTSLGEDESLWNVGSEGWISEVPAKPIRFLSFLFGHEPRRMIIHSTSPGYDVAQPIMSNGTGSETSLQAAKRWLSDCHVGHAQCNNRSSDPDFLPSRLIDIGLPGSSPRQPARLCTSAEIERGTRYFTISHRWSTDTEVSNLRQDSLAQFSKEIPASALTKHFVDAMDVVRFMGYRYIWIDALCIIQDCDEDWRRECSQMGKIYRNAFCNISQDRLHGLFSSRDPQSLEPVVIRAERGGLERSHWVIHHRLPGSDTCIPEAPLYNRGWVIQEWFMAPRILHFGENLITWECCEGSASEAYPTYQPGRKVLSFTKKSSLLAEQMKGVTDCLGAWSYLVLTYSGTDLTVPRDKFPAISAVSKEIYGNLQKATGEKVEYLAGLWSPYFAQQLLWVSRSEATACSPATYRAPSWSWASLNGSVFPARPSELLEKNVVAEILEKRVSAAGPDPFLEITEGSIRARSWLWRIQPASPLGRGKTEGGIIVRYDVLDQELNETSGKSLSTVYLMPVQVDAMAISQTLTLKTKTPELCYIPYVRICGLALARDATDKGHFNRVGTFILEVDARKVVSIPIQEDRKATVERINNMDVGDIIEPTLRHGEEILDLHSFDPSLDPNDYEEYTEDTRYQMNNTPRSAQHLYTITII